MQLYISCISKENREAGLDLPEVLPWRSLDQVVRLLLHIVLECDCRSLQRQKVPTVVSCVLFFLKPAGVFEVAFSKLGPAAMFLLEGNGFLRVALLRTTLLLIVLLMFDNTLCHRGLSFPRRYPGVPGVLLGLCVTSVDLSLPQTANNSVGCSSICPRSA